MADKSKKELDLNSFHRDWLSADESTKLDLIDQASRLSPVQGIVPVMTGMNSYIFSVRTLAKKSLGLLKLKAGVLQSLQEWDRNGDKLHYIHDSSVFSARIHEAMKPDLPVHDLRLYMEILLEVGGRGPFYAWRFYQSGIIPVNTLKNIVSTISEYGQLALVSEYLRSTPCVRRRFARHFKSILHGIRTPMLVIQFLADLFDRNLPSDPFLANLNPELRDPLTLLSMEFDKGDSQQRARAIKAMAMMVPRIAPGLLLSLLSLEQDEMVYSAVLSVVEVSPRNAYPELCQILMDRVCTQENDDLCWFRALVVSTPASLLGLVHTIRIKAPHLMKAILDELSTLSKISFLFVEEIAVNRNSWLRRNMDIYKALVYGMIKKRPERVIKLLETASKGAGPGISKVLVDLTAKVGAALLKEKEEIRVQGEALMLKLKESCGRKPGFFEKFLPLSLKKRLLTLKQGGSPKGLDFGGEILDNIDLSSGIFFLPTLFNGATIRDSDLSFSSFLNARFRESKFCNVNLNGARFDSICFDNAVFIKVSAKGAIFINCSFENASFFEVNFESASMVDCIFTGAEISCSLFLKADLSGSSFACTRTANVSFADSTLLNADFSGIQARFTQFPSHVVATLESEFANFNALLFVFDKNDLIDLPFDPEHGDPFLLEELELLILTDLIHSGKQMFLRQNKFSILTAFDIFNQKQADLFEIVPLLIHENIDFPGYNSDSVNDPCGISGYCPSPETGITAAPYVDPEKIKIRFNLFPHVEGLFTMGSTGTIAQTSGSDIDYWVCVRDHDPESLKGKRFHKKLRLLERWALESFKAEIHFFIVDINRARVDDFGDSTRESSGSAQGRILKEEFYRTMVHVAGKLPIWCAIPVSISRIYYDLLFKRICINPVQCRFIDLGDIHEIPPEEYFGASIWQIFKWFKSPFKSVIKMALLEEFINARGKKQLLCNRFKELWMNSGPHSALGRIDPYYILLKSLVDYYRQEENSEAARLVQLCFFLKTGISRDSDLDQTLFGFRSIFITICMDEWSWTRAKVFEIGNFRQWSYSGITKLSQLIERYMIKTYKRVNQSLGEGKQSIMITPEDLTVIGRKMFVEFSRQPEKVSKILLVSRSDSHFNGLALKYVVKKESNPVWELVNRSARLKPEGEELIKRGMNIEEIAAWFIQNRLYSTSTIINLVPNPTPVSSDDVQKLFSALHLFFIHDSSEFIRFKNLLSKVVLKAIFISLNFSIPRKSRRVHEFCAIYLNSWGEMFCKQVSSQEGFASVDEVLERLKVELSVNKLPERILFHFPRSFHL